MAATDAHPTVAHAATHRGAVSIATAFTTANAAADEGPATLNRSQAHRPMR
ncbi:MAG: hypothetical protein Q8K22_03780 [Rhodoferax sp.]|nr:hypothetical protein [Rhodoferax sp.]